MKKICLSLALLFITIISYSQIFLEVKGLQGDGPQGQQVLSYSFGASNPVTIGPGGGMSAGKVSFSSFNFLMQRGKMSLALLKAVAVGTHFEQATIKIYDDNNKTVNYQITFSNVMIESFQQSMGCGKKDCEDPTESVSMAYGKIKIEDFKNKTIMEFNVATNR